MQFIQYLKGHIMIYNHNSVRLLFHDVCIMYNSSKAVFKITYMAVKQMDSYYPNNDFL